MLSKKILQVDDAYQKGVVDGVEQERARCVAIAARDVEVVDEVSGTRFMRKPNCTCAKDLAGER